MGKMITLLSIMLIITGMAMASEYEYKDKRSLWCEQNWEKCKQRMMERLSVREKYLAKKKECLQKAKDLQSYRECMASLKMKYEDEE